MKEEEIAIRDMKEGKAAGLDNIEVEFLKLLDEQGIRWLIILLNQVNNSGNIPQD